MEAQHLSAFCPIAGTPRLVIINTGKVLDNIPGNVSFEELASRIQSAIGSTSDVNASAGDLVDVASVAQPEIQAVPELGTHRDIIAAQQQNVAETDADVRALFAERAKRLEKERQDAERSAREAKKKAAAEAKANAPIPDTPAAKSRRDWLEQQALRKQQAKSDKARVLQMIESDKQDRKLREEQRRIVAKSQLTQPASDDSEGQSQKEATTSSSPTCALLIRLFDGSSIRHKFDADATLATQVRQHVSEHSQTDVPYDFRQIRTPEPSKTISVSEEAKSLKAIGLAPSSTLVLVPVAGYTSAYSGQQRGLIAQGFGLGYNVVAGTLGVAGSIARGIASYVIPSGAEIHAAGTDDDIEPRVDESAATPSSSARIKVRTLADQRAEADKTVLYNGNQVSEL